MCLRKAQIWRASTSGTVQNDLADSAEFAASSTSAQCFQMGDLKHLGPRFGCHCSTCSAVVLCERRQRCSCGGARQPLVLWCAVVPASAQASVGGSQQQGRPEQRNPQTINHQPPAASPACKGFDVKRGYGRCIRVGAPTRAGAAARLTQQLEALARRPRQQGGG